MMLCVDHHINKASDSWRYDPTSSSITESSLYKPFIYLLSAARIVQFENENLYYFYHFESYLLRLWSWLLDYS